MFVYYVEDPIVKARLVEAMETILNKASVSPTSPINYYYYIIYRSPVNPRKSSTPMLRMLFSLKPLTL